ncbi:MAG: tetratricopeptide repeat protein, partial [Anaerolineae bacterium]
NIYSSRVFEPDKLTTLRSIALVMSGVWLVRWAEEWASGRRRQDETPRKRRITWRTPLVLPTLLTVVAYLVSTVFSVTPYISFFGSYQRLQGTFTMLSYIVIFFIILDRLRTRAQVDRLVTTLIVNSLPIALYGFVQRAKRDPLPWGGDVTRRVASNMGNAIFVAAYLIMAVPPTLSRVAESFRAILTDEDTGIADVLRASAYIFIFLVQVIAIYYTKSRGPLMGLLFGVGVWVLLGIILLQKRMLKDREDSSRMWRGVWIGTLVMIVVLGLLFFSINPGGPFHGWAVEQPAIGRLANVLEAESGTGKVRSLIWKGAYDMIMPHEPIDFPPTMSNAEWEWEPDAFNAIRPLVGYGPESMYVAYNSFYPPLLGHYESRTASPDRSHNETLDSIIITGLLGFAAYVWTFGALFYLGLRWLGVLPSDWRRILFFALLIGGAVVSTVATGVLIGPHFFGLAIPIGMTVGLALYLLIYGFSISWKPDPEPTFHPHPLLLLGALSTFVAHFVEINFGISIASTRTTFWALAGMFVLVGLQLIAKKSELAEDATARAHSRQDRRRRGRRTASRTSQGDTLEWLWPTLGAALIGALILGTLSYDFVNNVERLTNPFRIFIRSLTIIAIPAREPPRFSPGLLLVFGFTWLAIGLLSVAQMIKRGSSDEAKGWAWMSSAIVLLISLTVGIFFGLAMATKHANVASMEVQTVNDVLYMADRVAGQINSYYFFLIVIILLGGAALAGERILPRRWATPVGPLALAAVVIGWIVLSLMVAATTDPLIQPSALAVSFLVGLGLAAFIGLMAYLLAPALKTSTADAGWAWLGAAAAAIVLFLAPAFAYQYNLLTIRADIVYKQADPWDKDRQWQVAVPHYEKAIELVPREDFYYLYLGRAYLEYASSLEDPVQQDYALRQTERVLLLAQDINPLNTDHSANLARMYRRWASLPAGSEQPQALGELSSRYYDVATTLSPSNAILWNEWATLYQYTLNDEEMYQQTIQHSLNLDSEFEQTWLIISDVRAAKGDIEGAIEGYETALDIKSNQPQVWAALGRLYLQTEQNEEAIRAFSEYIEQRPNSGDIWDVHRMLAIAHFQAGELEQAMVEAQLALQVAPEEQQPMVQQLITQLQQTNSVTQTVP